MSAAPRKNAGRAGHRGAVGQPPLVADHPRGLGERARIEIEHRLGLRLVAGVRVVAAQQQEIADAHRGGAHEIALERDAVAVAAGELKDRLNAAWASSAAAAVAAMWARAPAPSVTLTASASPCSGSASARRSSASHDTGGTISAVITNSPAARRRASRETGTGVTVVCI